MKKIILLPVLIAVLCSCGNDHHNNTKTEVTDSLETNPHAVPSHVDTITHEDGLSNQSQVPDTTTTERSGDSLIH